MSLSQILHARNIAAGLHCDGYNRDHECFFTDLANDMR